MIWDVGDLCFGSQTLVRLGREIAGFLDKRSTSIRLSLPDGSRLMCCLSFTL